MTLSKAHQAIADSATMALEQDRANQRIMTKWLKGYSITDIFISEGGISHGEIRKAIGIKREELAEAQKGEIDHIIAERIAGLKMLSMKAQPSLKIPSTGTDRVAGGKGLFHERIAGQVAIGVDTKSLCPDPCV